MVYDYNKLFGETRDALGKPTPVFVDFFDRLGRAELRVLDVGCGQGRDAVFIARLGHRVTGVDLSSNGIADLNAVAARENLTIDGIVADITGYTPDGIFDIILIDRTLHMLGVDARHRVLRTMLDHVAQDGWVLIADEASNMDGFVAVQAAHHADWATEMSERGYLFLRKTSGGS